MSELKFNPEQIIKECQCPRSGFCAFFGQEMTYQPPNWQWCQNATPEERMWYKEQVDKKHDRYSYKLSGKFITISNMIHAIKTKLLPKLATLNLKGIAGVPRSGVFPASLIAMWLGIPIYAFNKEGDLFPLSALHDFGGFRMQNHKDGDGNILILDDTLYGGIAIRNVKETIGDRDDVLYGVVYVHSQRPNDVDVFAETLDPPHLLEWNFFNSAYVKNSFLDLDGILCPNVPYECSLDEESYIDYITNAEPLYYRKPSTYKCKGIITARLEKYRDITEQWLEKHNIKYGELIMFPTEREKERDANHVVEAATFKAQVISRYPPCYYIESEIPEARIIREKALTTVICPQEGKFA
tara:strand:+ start:1257 stop:2318 length:1062 start_codon:yes stop_codon:yes gene_type:complete